MPARAASPGPRRYAALGAIATALALFPFTAKPITWDELVYMGLAFYPEPRGWVLNRYAHAYAMHPFMWLSGDPYVGARAYWSALFGVTVGALIWTALQLPDGRGRVLALALVLLAGQQTLFAFPGIAYADFAVMTVMTVAVALVLVRIVRGDDLSAADAAALGALCLVGMKAKETVLPLLALIGLFFIAPSGRLRFDRVSARLLRAWLLGAALALLGILALDGILLGDPLFSLRPWAWRRLLEYNLGGPRQRLLAYTGGGPHPSVARDWLEWMPQQPPYLSFGLYIAAGVLWLRRARDPRLLLVYLLPALFLLMLTMVATYAKAPPRYLIPALPVLCLLAGLAAVRVLDSWRDIRGGQMAITIATLAIVTLGSLPIARVAGALVGRNIQRAGEERFAGFRQVARAVQVEAEDVVFVSHNLYAGGIRPGLVATLTRMNFNARLPAGHIVAGDTPPPDADYAVLDFDEYARWLATPGGDAARAVLSEDQTVALICLRRACPRR